MKNDHQSGPSKGDIIPPPDDTEQQTPPELPSQEEFWRPPVRFGSIPVEKEPLGWDRRQGFFKLFPRVSLPMQVVERVSFGHPDLEPNRLFWGDNLHVMRQLPSESIDLIYIDPPFFSGRQYNVIFGDQNEIRSFSDIWEGGMPGYLIWLNARLYEMKRLLKKTGSIYVHCDWHASHYIKVEMDKIFGNEKMRNEIVWHYYNKYSAGKKCFPRAHDVLLFYSKTDTLVYNEVREKRDKPYKQLVRENVGGVLRNARDTDGNLMYREVNDKKVDSVWRIPCMQPASSEWIGYPTQKHPDLLERVIVASSNVGDIVADFFCGGGTTPAVAQRLNRRWIACDQSRVAVAITADRVSRVVEEKIGKVFPVPDFTIEHWGVYESARLSKMPPGQFREFVLRAFGAVSEPALDSRLRGNDKKKNGGDKVHIHGHKGAIPVWVGEPDMRKSVTKQDVLDFANAVRKTVRYQQDNLRNGIMLAWAFRPDAMEAAERLRRLEQTDLNFIRLDMIRIDMPNFRQHVTGLTTKHADYENFLTFVQPPRVEVGWKRMAHLQYRFDVSESIVMNSGAKIINVQWDFNYQRRFVSTPKYSFNKAELQTDFKFPRSGKFKIACKVQDDMGGEGMWTGDIEVN